jgi:hypothetical protein
VVLWIARFISFTVALLVKGNKVMRCYILAIVVIFLLNFNGGFSWSAKASPLPRAVMISDALIPPDIQNMRSDLIRSGTVAPGYYETSEYLIGSVAVGIVFLESNGTIDTSTEDWGPTEESKVISEIQTGLSWWANQNPSAWVSYKYDIHYRVPTRYEPINRPHTDQNLWVSEAMAYLGYAGSYYLTQVRDYINALRNSSKTNWAFAIFVVDSSNDSDGEFTDGYFAYAYVGGPFLVMTYKNDNWGIDKMDIVTAHEMGHIFYATDEYDLLTEYSGYLNVADVHGSGCLMDGSNTWPPCLSSGTRGQVGWRDTDGDGIQDIVDTFPKSDLTEHWPDITNDTTLSYTGWVTEVAYPNRNPRGTGKNVTINTIVRVEYRIDSGAWLNTSSNDGSFDEYGEVFSFTTEPLSSGTHDIEVQATNSVNNTETSFDKDTITVDATPPITNLSYSSPNYVSGATVYVSRETSFTLAASDTVTGVANTYFKLESGIWMQYGGSLTFSGTSDGLHTLSFYSKDMAGNRETTKSFSFVMDNTAPTISLILPSNESAVALSSVNVSWAGLDNGSDVATYEIRIDAENYVNTGLSTSHIFSGLVEGNHSVYIKSVDNLGNINEVSVHFSVDVSLPTISITSPTTASFTNVTSVTAMWTGSDAVSGIEHYEVKLDDGAWLNVGKETAYMMLGIGEGAHSLTVKAVDKAGNVRESVVSFVVDITSPIITIASPTPSYLTNIPNIAVVWNGLDETSGIEHYEIKFDGGSWINMGTLMQYTISGINDGSHNLIVRAIDKAGNIQETDTFFTIDTTSPLITITSPKSGSDIRSSTIVIDWSGLDETSGIDHYKIRLDENSWISLETSTTYKFDSISDGSHIIDVEATDKAGNSRQTRINLVVNTSLIGGPGWTDDMIVFGTIVAVAAIAIGLFLIRRHKKQKGN